MAQDISCRCLSIVEGLRCSVVLPQLVKACTSNIRRSSGSKYDRDKSPFARKNEEIVRNTTQGHWFHFMLLEERLCCIKIKVSAQKVSHEVALGPNVRNYRMELEMNHQVKKLPEETSH